MASVNIGNNSELYVVMDGSKIGGIYRWRDDANAHSEAVGGSVIVQPIRYEMPGWVKTMISSAKEKAAQQSRRG